MSLVGLLASTILVSLVVATTISGVTAIEQSTTTKLPIDHDNLILVLLLNRQGLRTKNPVLETIDSRIVTPLRKNYDYQPNGIRDKRIGSLSIVNSVDVLRQRVLLELARRKAMEDQRQISENRRILDSVGKRSDKKVVHQIWKEQRPEIYRRLDDTENDDNDDEVEVEEEEDESNRPKSIGNRVFIRSE